MRRRKVHLGIIGPPKQIAALPPEVMAQVQLVLVDVAKMLNNRELVLKIDGQFREGRMSDVVGFDWFVD